MDSVEKLSGKDGRRRQGELWGDIRRALNEVYKQAPQGIDPIAQRFINYVGVKEVSALQGFPDLWDYQRKARFLLSIMSNDISVVSAQLQNLPIYWPTIPNSHRLRSPFQEVLDHQVKTRAATYNKLRRYDYLRLCKDAIKHWPVMPDSVKVRMEVSLM